MNDALIGTWIKLSNIVVALMLTVINSQFSVGFQRNLEQFVKGPNPNDDNISGGLNRGTPFWLCILNLTLAIVVFIHVCIDKIKQRNTTPVIHINIPNPQAPVNNLVAINNQPYNQDLLDFSSYFILVLANLTLFLTLSLVVSLDLNSSLAHYFQVSDSDFYTVFDLIRRLTHTLGIGFLLPLLLMLLSSELRPFLLKCLSSGLWMKYTIIQRLDSCMKMKYADEFLFSIYEISFSSLFAGKFFLPIGLQSPFHLH